mgnify:CR=1 FL=1
MSTLLLDDVRTYLISQGLVEGSTGWSCTEAYMPDDADKTVAIFETGGLPADTLDRKNRAVTFQTRVRAARLDFTTARTKWQQIFDALQDAQVASGSPQSLVGYVFIQAMAVAPTHFNDNNGRPNLTSHRRCLRTGL